MNARTLETVLAALSPEEAKAVYNALAQWADNERNHLDESEGSWSGGPSAEEVKAVALVEGVVQKLEAVILR